MEFALDLLRVCCEDTAEDGNERPQAGVESLEEGKRVRWERIVVGVRGGMVGCRSGEVAVKRANIPARSRYGLGALGGHDAMRGVFRG